MTSGAQTFVPVLQAPTVGKASSPVNVQVTKSAEFATGTCLPPLLVENAYQVPSRPLTKDGSGKLLVITGPVIPRLFMAAADTRGIRNREERSEVNMMGKWECEPDRASLPSFIPLHDGLHFGRAEV